MNYCLAELLDQGYGLSGKTPLELSATMGTEDIDELISGHVEKGIQINAPEGELLEHSLLWLPYANISLHIYLQM